MRDGAASHLGAVVVLLVLIVSGCSGGRATTEKTAVEPDDGRNTPTQAPGDVRDDATQSTSSGVFDSGYRVVPRSTRPEVIPTSGYDLEHTTLNVTLDFKLRTVDGDVAHTLTVTADSLDVLRFHAYGTTIHEAKVRLGGEDIEVGWDQAGQELRLHLPSMAHSGDSAEVTLSYRAMPYATAPRRGLYFVDPAGTDPSRPTEVWTIGQPEDNRIWLPTWDYPNDRMTFDLRLTVPDSLVTVATGELVESITSGNYRTDRWVLEVPQPAYLFSVAAGDFASMEDTYVSPVGKSTPLQYFVEPQYDDMIETIFGLTPDVMDVIERKTAIPFPFAELKQTTVRDFTASGMENSTSILYDSRLQHDQRAHLDYTGTDLIVHEISHQWFGDFVTCRSWAYLALNEGFANFMEQVYLEESAGADRAQEHRIADRDEYLEESRRFRRPIIWTEYTDPNQLFDSHSYEKTELVLNTLRYEIGEEAFWNGIRIYLSSSDDGDVDLTDLKDAMERSTRRSLSGFFDQWFMEPGHPELLVDHGYNEVLGVYEVRVRQVQDLAAFPLYSLDADIELNYETGATYKERVHMSSADTTYRFGVAGRIAFARFDEGDQLLADIKERKPLDQWLLQAVSDDEMASRYDAVLALAEFEATPEVSSVLLESAESDDYDLVRMSALDGLARFNSLPAVLMLARRVAVSDESSRCRRAAIRLLAASGDPSALAVVRRALSDESYFVVAEAVSALAALNPENLLQNLAPALNVRSWESVVELAVLGVLSAHPDGDALPYLERMMAGPNPDELRLAAIRTLSGFSSLGRDWQRLVRQRLEILSRDPNESVGAEASRLLKGL